MTHRTVAAGAAALLLGLTLACGVGPISNPIAANPTVAAAATSLANAQATIQPAIATVQSGVATFQPTAQALLQTVQSGVATAGPSAVALLQTAQAGVQTALPALVQTPGAAIQVGAERYVPIAQAGAGGPGSRPQAWGAELTGAGELRLTLPLDAGASTAETVQAGQQRLAQAVKALFDGAPELTRVAAVGTLPDGAGGAEQEAISIAVARVAYEDWSGAPPSLGSWQISPRLQ